MGLSPEEVRRYSDMMAERRRCIDSAESIMGAQQFMRAGSRERDATMEGVDNGLDRAGELNKELMQAGIMDGWGRLTDRARAAGVTMPERPRW